MIHIIKQKNYQNKVQISHFYLLKNKISENQLIVQKEKKYLEKKKQVNNWLLYQQIK